MTVAIMIKIHFAIAIAGGVLLLAEYIYLKHRNKKRLKEYKKFLDDRNTHS